MKARILVLLALVFSLPLTGCSYHRVPYELSANNVMEIRYDSIYPEHNDPLIFPADSIEHFVEYINTFVEQLELGEPEGKAEAFLRFLQKDGREVSIARTAENIYRFSYKSNSGQWLYHLESEELESFYISMPEPLFYLRDNPIKDSHSGFITSIEGYRILVVSDTRDEEYNFYSATWYSIPEEYLQNVLIGQKVDVIAKGVILRSYPSQTAAKELYIYPDMKPDGAALSRQQAIFHIINHLRRDDIWKFAFESITLNQSKETWHAQLIDASMMEGSFEAYVDQAGNVTLTD